MTGAMARYGGAGPAQDFVEKLRLFYKSLGQPFKVRAHHPLLRTSRVHVRRLQQHFWCNARVQCGHGCKQRAPCISLSGAPPHSTGDPVPHIYTRISGSKRGLALCEDTWWCAPTRVTN